MHLTFSASRKSINARTSTSTLNCSFYSSQSLQPDQPGLWLHYQVNILIMDQLLKGFPKSCESNPNVNGLSIPWPSQQPQNQSMITTLSPWLLLQKITSSRRCCSSKGKYPPVNSCCAYITESCNQVSI